MKGCFRCSFLETLQLQLDTTTRIQPLAALAHEYILTTQSLHHLSRSPAFVIAPPVAFDGCFDLTRLTRQSELVVKGRLSVVQKFGDSKAFDGLRKTHVEHTLECPADGLVVELKWYSSCADRIGILSRSWNHPYCDLPPVITCCGGSRVCIRTVLMCVTSPGMHITPESKTDDF